MSSRLDSKESRKNWEETFNKVYIQPVLEDKDNKLKHTIEAALSGEIQDHDQLLCLLYERMEVRSGDPFPHFWTYRTPFTFAHLMQTLQNKDTNRKFPILHEFLREEVSLRATQHIPDIVQLQQFLHDKFNHRLYKSEAASKTFKDIEKKLREPQKSRIHSLFEGLCRAWSLVKDKLLLHARFPLEEEHVVAEITADTPLVHLLPTTTGAGVCTTVLIDYLVQVHNSFVFRCKGMMTEKQERRIVWEPLKIAVGHVHRCHLIDYEKHILSVVFSHCHRTLRVGKGEDVKYDLEALEQHLVSRFIAGKPIINLEIPHVLYHTDVYTAERFASIQKHVKPQVDLEAEERNFILDKLHSESQNIRQVLDVVNTVLGFLASAGGQSKNPLVEYVRNVLKKECPFSQALKHCTLGHIISLWKVLSVELATQLTLHGEEPFESFKAEFMVGLQSRSEEAQLETYLGLWRARDRLDFLETLYEFIELHVRHCELHEREHRLLDHLDAYLERCGKDLNQSCKGFPATVTLAKAIATWKFAAKLNYKRKQEMLH